MLLHELVAANKYDEVEKLLLENPQLINLQDEETNRTPLHIAVLNQDNKMVELLAKYHPDTAIIDLARYTVLEYAITFENPSLIKLLVQKCHASLETPSAITNYSPLRSTVEDKQFIIAALLLDLGANPLGKDHLGVSLLEKLDKDNYPKEWWVLFISYGAFIGNTLSFSNITLHQLTEMTKCQFICDCSIKVKLPIPENCTLEEFRARPQEKVEPVTDITPGFHLAIFDRDRLAELLDVANDFIHHSALINAVKRCKNYAFDDNMQRIIKLLEAKKSTVKSLKYTAAMNIFYNRTEVPINSVQDLTNFIDIVKTYGDELIKRGLLKRK